MLEGKRAFPAWSAVVNPTPVPSSQPMIAHQEIQSLPSNVAFKFECEDSSLVHGQGAETIAAGDDIEDEIETDSMFFVLQRSNSGKARGVHGSHAAPGLSLLLSHLHLLSHRPADAESLTVALESEDGNASGY